jgi:hypothetical protein
MTEHGPSTVSARLTSCPGCGHIESVEQTSSTPRVAAWKCRCGMAWAISLVNHGQRPAYFDQLDATRSVLRQVITLAGDSATLSDPELRDCLLALADRARLAQHPIVQDSGGVTVSR